MANVIKKSINDIVPGDMIDSDWVIVGVKHDPRFTTVTFASLRFCNLTDICYTRSGTMSVMVSVDDANLKKIL